MIVDFSKGLPGVVFYEVPGTDAVNFSEGVVFVPDDIKSWVIVKLESGRIKLIPYERVVDIEYEPEGEGVDE